MAEEKKKLTVSSLKSAYGVFRYLRPYVLLYTIGMILLAISALLVIVITSLLGLLLVPEFQGSLPGGALTQFMVKTLQLNPDWGTTGKTLTALVGLLIIQGVFSFFRIYIFSYVTENAMMALRNDTFSKVIRMPMPFFHERRIGDLSSRISSDITTIQETLSMTLAEFIRQIIIIVVGVGWLVSYSYKLTLVMVGSLPVIIIIMVIFGKFIRKLGKVTQDKVAESSVIVNETLTGIVNVKSFTNEKYESGRFAESGKAIRQVAMKSAVWRGMFGTFIIIFLFGALGLVIGVGAHLVETGELPASVLPQFIMLTGLVAGSFGGLAAQMGTMQRSIGVIENVMEILDFQSEKTDIENASKLSPLKGRINFTSVSFSYASRPDTKVLKNLTFSIEAGQQVAIVGHSGSGKSTLASLLLRFYEPDSGSIHFDNKKSSELPLGFVRSHIAYVPQEVILFGGTIEENISYGRPGATMTEIKEAARKANALEFIESFPDKFKTLVGERGIQLSGGQRQRIAIARAVLRNPVILILDEATSSLDSESERLVQDALDNLMKGRTSFVIAHRLSTIRNADKILVMESGELKEEGTHNELIALKDGMYRRLSELQNEKEEKFQGNIV